MHDGVAPEELAKWNRWFAIECNNRAWRLAEAPSRSPAESEEMLHSAHAAALHWSKVGTELHKARATMLLAHVHALVGDGKRALGYAQSAYEALGAALPNAEERSIFAATFGVVPREMG